MRTKSMASFHAKSLVTILVSSFFQLRHLGLKSLSSIITIELKKIKKDLFPNYNIIK